MKKLFYATITLALFSATSCEKEAADKSSEIRKEVSAEIVNGKTTVTITTTENGKEDIKVLTGKEAEDYMVKNSFEGENHPEGAEIIIKNLSNSSTLNINVEEVLSDPELEGIDAETKAKIKNALENALSESEINVDKTGEMTVTSKVIVINDEEDN
jgi:hypothetical protein